MCEVDSKLSLLIHRWLTEYYSLTNASHLTLSATGVNTRQLERMQAPKHLLRKQISSCCRAHGNAHKMRRPWQRDVDLLAAVEPLVPFHVVPRQHPARYHFAGMTNVYDFYGYKRKHSHKFWQGESLSWLVGLGEVKKTRDKRQQGPWLGTWTGIEGSSPSINHSHLIYPFILWDRVQAGPWLGSS